MSDDTPKNNNELFSKEDQPKFDEIKQMLANNSIPKKLDGMKRIIAMVSKGRDVSFLFPDVVKNVICKHLEVKKLVYHYLIHYAESEPEASLLSINSFQKDLNDSNQVIRAAALKVLSSIRVKVITQIIVLSVQKCISDFSPFVRKAACHAVTKIYSIDPKNQYDTLVEIISKLLNDRSPMVVGSAIAAFNEVCPLNWSLIHVHYRTFCRMCVDLDPWSQVHTITMLTRYARAHFINPNSSLKENETKKKGGFWEDGSDEESEDDRSFDEIDNIEDLDADHRMLINSISPLLQSSNNAVVMVVVSCFYYLAPAMEAQKCGKAIIRILRNHREIQYIVLTNITSMASKRPEMFLPYISEFFVRSTDPIFISSLKLEILTYLANETNISKILREFNTYIKFEDKKFVSNVIQAIGRCACLIPTVTDTVMHGLTGLMLHTSEIVVAESVVAIKKILQLSPNQYKSSVAKLARLLEKTTVPKARESIIWVIGEYNQVVPEFAPDILRSLTKTFIDESDPVKLQVLNLGAKLLHTNPEQTKDFFKHILTLAKYDKSYDIRDRARILNKVLFNVGGNFSKLSSHSQRLVLTTKPTPSIENPSRLRERFVLGSLSHLLCKTADNYIALPDHPVNLDESAKKLREQGDFTPTTFTPSGISSSNYSQTFVKKMRDDGWSTEEEEEGEDEDEEGEEDEDEEGEEEEEEEEPIVQHQKKTSQNSKSSFESLFSNAWGSNNGNNNTNQSSPSVPKNNTPSLLNWDTVQPSPPSLNNLLSGPTGNNTNSSSVIPTRFTAIYNNPFNSSENIQLLSSTVTGSFALSCIFLRRQSIQGRGSNVVQLTIENQDSKPVQSISMNPQDGPEVTSFNKIDELSSGSIVQVIVNVTYKDWTTPAKFKIATQSGIYSVQIPPPIGELVVGSLCNPEVFRELQKTYGGMNQTVFKFSTSSERLPDLKERVLKYVNINSLVTEENLLTFFGTTLVGEKPVMVSVSLDPSSGEAVCQINCPDTIFSSILTPVLKKALIEAFHE